MHNKDKLHINIVIRKDFSSIYSYLKGTKCLKDSCEHQNWLLQPLLYQRPKGYEKNIEKIIQVRNGNKRFTTFPTMSNTKNISLITEIKYKMPENSNEYLRSFVKGLKIKFVHSMARSMGMLSIKMRALKGLKNDIFNQQSWRFFQSTKQSPRGVLWKRCP